MFPLTLERVIETLKEFTKANNADIEIILIGGLALHHYGLKDRATIDIDAEVKGNIEALFNFLKHKEIPSDMGEDIAGWSVVTMPPGYRERTIRIYKDEHLTVKVLHPLDFVVAKLRRATEEDLEDAAFVVKQFGLKFEEIKETAEEAIRNSPKDTALFIFKKNVALFLSKVFK